MTSDYDTRISCAGGIANSTGGGTLTYSATSHTFKGFTSVTKTTLNSAFALTGVNVKVSFATLDQIKIYPGRFSYSQYKQI